MAVSPSHPNLFSVPMSIACQSHLLPSIPSWLSGKGTESFLPQYSGHKGSEVTLGHAGGGSQTCLPLALLEFEWEMLPQAHVFVGFQVMALFWKVVEPLGGGTLLEKVGHRHVTFYIVQPLLPVYSFLPD